MSTMISLPVHRQSSHDFAEVQAQLESKVARTLKSYTLDRSYNKTNSDNTTMASTDATTVAPVDAPLVNTTNNSPTVPAGADSVSVAAVAVAGASSLMDNMSSASD